MPHSISGFTHLTLSKLHFPTQLSGQTDLLNDNTLYQQGLSLLKDKVPWLKIQLPFRHRTNTTDNMPWVLHQRCREVELVRHSPDDQQQHRPFVHTFRTLPSTSFKTMLLLNGLLLNDIFSHRQVLRKDSNRIFHIRNRILDQELVATSVIIDPLYRL